MRLSVIVPVYNDKESLQECLVALFASSRIPDEIIVVDDGSTDGSGDVAREFGVVVEKVIGKQHGPALPRNIGSKVASGDVLIFFDSDVAVHNDTIEKMEKYLIEYYDIDALFGSYDEFPVCKSTVSQYKNLHNHYIHQNASREAITFWAACGAVRRDVFRDSGGFDPDRFALEDIEFGMRLRRGGYKIVVFPDIQVTHLKKWTFWKLIRSDIIDRAIPWTQLIVDSESIPNDMNVNFKSRISAFLIWASILSLFFLNKNPLLNYIGPLFFIVFYYINRNFYYLCYQCGGFIFTILSIILHILYYMYSSVVFIIVFCFMSLNKIINSHSK